MQKPVFQIEYNFPFLLISVHIIQFNNVPVNYSVFLITNRNNLWQKPRRKKKEVNQMEKEKHN